MSDSLWPQGLQYARLPCPSLSPGVLLKLLCIESVMPFNHLILRRPLLLLPTAFPSTRLFSRELALRMRWPKYWSFSFKINPSNEYSGLIAFRTNWFDLPAVQGTLESLLQHHSSKASILWCSASFMVQLSHPYVTPGNPWGSASPDGFQKCPRLPGSRGSPRLGRSVLCVECFAGFPRGRISIDSVASMQHAGPSDATGENLLFSKFNSFYRNDFYW